MAQPAEYNLDIYQGDDFSLFVRLKDGATQAYLDLTGYTGQAQLRRQKSDPTALETFTVAIASPQSGDTLGGVYITMTKVQTAALDGIGVWDFELTDAVPFTRTYLAGAFTVTPEVTK